MPAEPLWNAFLMVGIGCGGLFLPAVESPECLRSAPSTGRLLASLQFQIDLNMTTSRIPARIIQTGKDGNLPLMAKAAVANVKLLNPRFEYLFFTDHDVVALCTEGVSGIPRGL